MKTDGPWNKEGSFHTTSRGNLTNASSRVGNRKSNHIQVIPTTNKFKVLSNLNDPREAVSSMSASIDRVITSKNLGKKKTEDEPKENLRTRYFKKEAPKNSVNRRQPCKKLCNRPTT